MLCPVPLFPGCRKPVSVAIRTVNGKSGEHVVLDAGDVPLDASDKSRTVADEFRDIRGILGSAGSLRKVEDYLYEADFTHLDAAGAETHFRERFGSGAAPGPFGFGCSVVRLGNRVGRAYDWKYDEAVTFVVHTPADGTRFASVAVCPSPAGMTRRAVESLSVPGSLWTALPFYATDGMNEHGVTCSVCVVRAKGDESVLWHGREFCAVGAVRQVLDRARTAREGADIIASGAWMPAPDKLGNYSLHFMVTDASHTFVVEDGVVIDITDDEVKAMTNFRLGSRVFPDEAGHADADRIASYDPYGTGVERYNELVDYVKSASEETGMREWLTRLVFSDAYGESPLTGSTPRPSEFAGAEISRDHFAKINETEAIEAWFKSSRVHEKWALRERDGKFWQTVHSAVYDVASRMVSVVVQEGSAVHDFPVVCEGGGSGTVKSVNDVEPDSKTGNVVLTAQDIPYGGEGASNVETAIELNTQAAVDNAEAIDSLEEQVGEIKTTTYTKSEVDDKISQNAAHYLTKRTGTEGHYSYPQFATHADLAAAKAAHTEANPQFFYGIEAHTPDKNDYCVVLADETHDGSTTRYAFVGSWDDNGYFRYQYTINETPFTDRQWAAINSLTSVDEDGNLCFDGIPFVNSRGELLFTEDDPVFTAWKNEVQVILGGGANVASGKYKQIAIGAHATANGQNSIALGSSEPGGKTNGPRAMAQNAIAIGAGANATATNAVQILAGTNNTTGTIQLGNKTVAFLSDIPISQADIDDYRYYKGHWGMGVTYKTGDIVRAERTVEGDVEVVYFRSLKDANIAQNPFTSTTYWARTTDDEGLEKLTLLVNAAIATLTGADIPVSPTNTDSIEVALGKKRDYSDLSYSFWKGRQAGPLFKADDPAAGWENAEWQLTWRKAPAGGGSAGWWLTYRKSGTSFFTAGDSGLSHIEFYSGGYLLDTLDLTSGGPIALVSQLADKLSISEVVEPSADAKTGQAAGAKAVATALEGKLSTELSGNSQTIRSSGIAIRLDFSTVNGAKISLGASENGLPYVGVDDGKGTRDSQKVLRLPTTFFGLIETLAVASQLSGVTSQDITDFLHYDPTAFIGDDVRLQHDVEAETICRYGSSWYFRVITDASEGEDVAFIDKTDYTTTDGFKRLIDLFGESNSQLAKTIEDKAVIFLRYSDGFIYKGEVADANKITKFSDLAAMVRTGRAVLQATATSASGSSPVLFRPHMINDGTGAQEANILFDATGTIGEGVYTRCIRAAIKAGTADELLVQGNNQRERLAKYDDVPYAVVDTVENRSVKRVVISTADAMTVTLPKPTASSGVIDFEVWFDASAYAGTYPSIGYKYDSTTDADVVTKDGEDLVYGDGAVTIVHFTSVNGSAYTAVAASFK